MRRDAEPWVQKAYPDAFDETDLESVLAERGIGRQYHHAAPGRTAGTVTTADVNFTANGDHAAAGS